MKSIKPRIGCVGLGWIGRLLLRSLVESDVVSVVALADPDPDALEAALGLVIATPSAQHASGASQAERPIAVVATSLL
jgi:prephenate dehydrogenase